MNQYKMLEAVREAVGGKMPEGLDQIWYAEAGGPRSGVRPGGQFSRSEARLPAESTPLGLLESRRTAS
jgi:hypothetical protein